jgi:hypothetical protein
VQLADGSRSSWGNRRNVGKVPLMSHGNRLGPQRLADSTIRHQAVCGRTEPDSDRLRSTFSCPSTPRKCYGTFQTGTIARTAISAGKFSAFAEIRVSVL